MFFSIIIPIYNVEPYLARCLDSVLAAVSPEDELILSMGASQDRSNEICAQYAERYPNIRLIMQAGKGLSDARNCAVRQAGGDYILYVDSDDFVDSDVLTALLERVRGDSRLPDVVVTDFRRLECKTGKLVDVFQIGADTPDRYGAEHLPEMLRRRQCFWNVWRYLYRRAFLEEHGITFLDNLLSEDVDYTTTVFLADPHVLFSHSPYYTYCVGRGSSLMDLPTLRRLTDTIFILERSIERLRSSDFPYAAHMIAQFQFEYLLSLALIFEIDPQDRTAAAGLYANRRAALADSTDPVVRVCRAIMGLLGVHAMGYGLHLLKIIRRFLRRYGGKREQKI